MRHTKIPRIALLVAVLCLSTVRPAAADPIRIRRDRSDNTFYFTYKSGSGRIKQATSSVFWRPRDRVDFFSYVVERKATGKGKQLKARIVLRLNRGRAVRYNGRFRFIIQDEDGETTHFRGSREVNFLLRPRKGDRKRYFRWIIDLPTGEYRAFARFRAD
jgi:hypothetical protein